MDDLRKHLIDQLANEHAHTSFERAVEGLNISDVGIRPNSLPYSIWELVEHLRIAQADILEFSVNPGYEAPKWPDDYWPPEKAPSGNAEWQRSLEAINSDLQEMIDLVKDPGIDLFTPFPHGDGQTLFREAILIIDHNSYHTGQIITIRRLLGLW
ncbi:DinB family protein [Halalkalibaculum sp. DA3122]|uniref:DinB family protein n=1 Tax=unclassified Halalkalibaculum TaxID=2964617 RepID=UPI003754B865